MKLTKKTLLYEISNMAYLIADTGDDSIHGLHRVRDICEEGNIDRVNQVLSLAQAIAKDVLSPLRNMPKTLKDRIRETVREFMICMVLADWLGVTYPEAAEVWRRRWEKALESLKQIASEYASSAALSESCAFTRRLSPF